MLPARLTRRHVNAAAAGRQVAAVLSGAWRADPANLPLSPSEFASAVPRLLACGAGALAWNRIRNGPGLRDAAEAAPLRDAHRYAALQEILGEASIAFVARLLANRGIEPLIFKGWAVAQHYAAPHLRPFGDIDFCAPPGCHSETRELLASHAVPGMQSPAMGLSHAAGNFIIDCRPRGRVSQIDLHPSLQKFQLQPLETVYARARRVAIEDTWVRVPAAEDHLRLLAMHFLRHGGWRPVWLTDIAAVLENLPPDFNWALCLGDEARTAHWISCVLTLAHRLLGARIDHLPALHRVDAVPGWLLQTVLREWAAPHPARFVAQPLAHVLRDPRIAGTEWRARWPNPINATVALGKGFDGKPRLPYQASAFAGWLGHRLTSRSLRPQIAAAPLPSPGPRS